MIQLREKIPEKNMIVTQSNKLIEARYNLTIYEQRLVLIMISMVEPEDEDFKDYIIKISDFRDLLELKNKNIYSQVKKILLRLRERTLLIPKRKNDFLITGWISSAEYISNEGIVKLSFDAKLKPYLLALKSNFTKQRLGAVIKLKGIYTIRIYGLLKQYEKLGAREFLLDDFRNILGIRNDQYTLFTNLKARTMTQAQKEFSKKNKEGFYISDINFDLEVRKTGKKISHLKFIIKKQQTKIIKQISPPISKIEHQQDPIELTAMLKILIPKKQALIFLEQYSTEYIIEKLELLTKHQQIENIQNPAGFFVKALKDDWQGEELDLSQAGLKEWANASENVTRTAGKTDNEIITMMKYDLEQSKLQTVDSSKENLGQWANAPENQKYTVGKSDTEIIAMMKLGTEGLKKAEQQKINLKQQQKAKILERNKQLDLFFNNLSERDQQTVLSEYQNSSFFGLSEQVEYQTFGLKSERAKDDLRNFLFSKKSIYNI